MEKSAYHIIPIEDGCWGVLKGGSVRLSKAFEVKKDAIVFGKQLVLKKKGELVIHQKDGTIISVESYDNNFNSSKR